MVTTICYGRKTVWADRNDAIVFFLDGVDSCDGCERERYMNVYLDLIAGYDVCTDKY